MLCRKAFHFGGRDLWWLERKRTFSFWFWLFLLIDATFSNISKADHINSCKKVLTEIGNVTRPIHQYLVNSGDNCKFAKS